MDGGFTRDLCVALEYRWNPDATFLLFIANFDESATHGPTPHMVMSALLGTARQWQLVERRLRGFQRRDGFKVFHATALRSGKGEFRGWQQDKKTRLVADLAETIRTGLTEGVTAILPQQMYRTLYRGEPHPIRMRLDSQYGICFRVCMRHLINALTAEQKRHKLHVVIESGHKNVGDASRIFDELKDECEIAGVGLLGDITIACKSGHPPLMIADFQAHAHYLSESRVLAGQPGYYELAGEALPRRGEAGTTQIKITPESLRGLKSEWQARNEEKVRQWREARDARRCENGQQRSSGD